MTKLSYITLKLLAGTFLIASAFATETTQDENRIQPGSRFLSHAERVKIQEQRASEAETNPVDEEVLPETKEEENKDAAVVLATPEASLKAGIYFTTHPGAFYTPILISAFGDTVELNDGSVWTVAGGDTFKVLNWLTSDFLVMTPNHDWFSSYMFRMTNQETGVSVKCNMLLGPIYNGLYTHWVVAIDYLSNEIFLEDGSRWLITGWDSATLNKWLPNDTVMIGINDGNRSSSHPNVLINVNTLTYARAICL
jgi:hypothetical protein